MRRFTVSLLAAVIAFARAAIAVIVAFGVSTVHAQGVPGLSSNKCLVDKTKCVDKKVAGQLKVRAPVGSWVRLGGPPGGLGYDIRMRPAAPDQMVVTDAFTGTYLSDDGGKVWVAANQGMESAPGGGAPIFCATIDPHDPSIIWAGTQLTGHLYRSVDSGQTWQERDNGILRVDPDLRSFRGITIDPNDPSVVYSALELSLSLESTERPAGWKGGTAGEVYKSTDGGLNWNRIWFGPSLARYVLVDPRNSNRLYVSTGIFDRDAANRDVDNKTYGGVGILRSDNGGQTWTVLNEQNSLGGLYVPSLFMHPTNPDILLAAVTVNRSFGMDPSINIGNPGAYVTYDGGTTWTKILGNVNAIDAVEIATSDPDVWYAATENTIFRSDNAGQTWQRFAMVTPDRNAGVPIDLQVDPRDPYRIFTNNYNGGNMLSTDGGQTWVDASHGYTGLRVHAVAVVPGTGGRTVLANEFRSEDGGLTWSGTNVFARSFEMFTPKDSATTRTMAAASYGTLTYSDDGGKTWSTPVQVGDTLGRPLSPRLAIAPSDPDRIYISYSHWNCLLGNRAGGGGLMPYCQEQMPGLFRSLDGGQTWEALQTAFGSWTAPALAVQPDDPQTVFAGTVQGLYVSRDGGSSWERVTSLDNVAMAIAKTLPDLNLLEDPTIWDLAYDPFDPQVLYAALLPGGLYRSRDGGATWKQIVFGMDPNEPVDDILPDPGQPGVLYAGSRFSGVYLSTDGGDTWQAIVSGMNRRDVSTLALSDDGNILYAGTASGNGGAGVWRLGDLPATPTISPTPTATPTLTLTPSPVPTRTPVVKSKCDAGKMQCVDEKQACLLGVYSKAEKKGVAVNNAAVKKCTDTFDGGTKGVAEGCIGKLEGKQDAQKPGTLCSVTGNLSALEGKVDAFVTDVVSAITPNPAGPNNCNAGKKRCVWKKASCLIKVHQNAVRKGVPVDDAALQKCRARFNDGTAEGCIRRLEAKLNPTKPKTKCSVTGDVVTLEDKVEALVTDVVSEIRNAP